MKTTQILSLVALISVALLTSNAHGQGNRNQGGQDNHN